MTPPIRFRRLVVLSCQRTVHRCTLVYSTLHSLLTYAPTIMDDHINDKQPASIEAKLFPVLLLFLAFLAPAARAAGNLDEGFKAPRDQILAQIKRVGFLPNEFAVSWPRNAAAAVELEALTTEMLTKAGISTVPLSVYNEFELRVRKEHVAGTTPRPAGPTKRSASPSLKRRVRSLLLRTNWTDSRRSGWT
jgi:hypothetical protein